MHSRMMDPNAAVREATIELLGKFLLVDLNYIKDYYHILLERIKVWLSKIHELLFQCLGLRNLC